MLIVKSIEYSPSFKSYPKYWLVQDRINVSLIFFRKGEYVKLINQMKDKYGDRLS